MELLSLVNDVVFKIFFTSKANEHLLIHFLQTGLGLSKGSLTEVTILNPELPKLTVDDKRLTVDLYAKMKTRDLFHIEMQAKGHAFFKECVASYQSKSFSTQ